MTPAYSEPAHIDPNCEIRVGAASWDHTQKSVKFTWFDKNGKACRGGEVPVEALKQMLSLTIRTGYLTLE